MKGQAAMEYLMTYGWALLVIVIVIASLVFVNPFAAPDTCIFSTTHLSCSNQRLISEDSSTSSSGNALTNVVYANIQNNEPKPIAIYGMACTRGGRPKTASDGNFENGLFRLDAGGAITDPSKTEAVVLSGNEINVGNMPNSIKFKMQCVDVDENGEVVEKARYNRYETFMGNIYIAYRMRGEPLSVPPKIIEGKLSAIVQ